MTEEQFQKLSLLYGFAPSRSLRELVEAVERMAEPHTGVTLKPVIYANHRLTNEEVDAVVGRPKAEHKENT